MNGRSLLLLALPLAFGACRSAEEEVRVELEPVSLEGWRTEHIPLPPEFAPGMPAGDEVLLFAPGMFDAQAEDFWSYVFVMRVEEGHLDAERLTELFEEYYDGLILAVGASRGLDVGADPATVQLARVGEGRYDAEVSLIDAFGTGERISLVVRIELDDEGQDSSFLRVQASPRGPEHEIWRALEYAAATLEL